MLDDTVAGATANTYQGVASAIERITLRLGGQSWLALDTEVKEQTLATATLILDSLEYEGEPATVSQNLQFPRIKLKDSKGRDLDPSVIPEEMLRAHAEMAFSLGVLDTTVESAIASIGITEVKASSVSVKFSDMVKFKAIPDNVMRFLPAHWLSENVAQVDRRSPKLVYRSGICI